MIAVITQQVNANKKIIKSDSRRDTLLQRMHESGRYHDSQEYPYGLMDEAAEEIKRLRDEVDRSNYEVEHLRDEFDKR